MKLRVLFVSDFHLSKKFIERTVEVVKKEKVDLVINSGDFLSNDYANKFFKRMDEEKMRTFVVNGNWDGDLTSDYDHVKVLYNQVEEFKGFFVLGIDEDTLFEEELYDLTENIDGRKLIVVAHYPPYKTKDRMWNGMHIGFKEYTRFIKKKEPLIFSCGHIHEDNGVMKVGKTLVVNSALASIPNGYVVEIPEKGGELKIKKIKFS